MLLQRKAKTRDSSPVNEAVPKYKVQLICCIEPGLNPQRMPSAFPNYSSELEDVPIPPGLILFYAHF